MSEAYFAALVNFAHNPDLPEDPVKRADVEAVLKDGYVVMENMVPPEDIEAMKAEMTRLTGDDPKMGRHIFEGHSTIRIYSLLNKTRIFDKYVLNDRILALNDYFLMRGYGLSATSTIQINPGEKPQMMHHDDGFTYLPRPRPPMGTAVMIAIDDFTADNGATRMVKGSHLWDSKRRPTEDEPVPTVCPSGTIMYFLGTTWHQGGPNDTDTPRRAATIQYCQPYIRPVENQFLSVDLRRLDEIPEPITKMMGYSIQRPFIGYVDGLDPLKGAHRMIEWFKRPLEKNVPGFFTMPQQQQQAEPQPQPTKSQTEVSSSSWISRLVSVVSKWRLHHD